MKFVLIVMFLGSAGTGPSMTVMTSAEFDDEPACQAAAKRVETMTRKVRIMGTTLDFICAPKALEGK